MLTVAGIAELGESRPQGRGQAFNRQEGETKRAMRKNSAQTTKREWSSWFFISAVYSAYEYSKKIEFGVWQLWNKQISGVRDLAVFVEAGLATSLVY